MHNDARLVPWIVFDGDCAFCTSSVNWLAGRLSRHDGSDPQLHPWQFTDLGALGTTRERTQQEVLWVTPEGRIFGGGQAFAQWLIHSGGAAAVLGRMLTVPGVRNLLVVAYRAVARNRHRLPGGSPACALPPAGTSGPGPATS